MKSSCVASARSSSSTWPAADVVICTAQVPGKKAPVLVTRDMVEGMRPGAVIVDIAAPQGGNCELTRLERGRRPQRRPDHRPG